MAVLPLSKKPLLTELARPGYATAQPLSDGVRRGRSRSEGATAAKTRSARQLAITVDFDSLEDNAVTIRERDGMTQVRVSLDDLEAACDEQLAACRAAASDRARG